MYYRSLITFAFFTAAASMAVAQENPPALLAGQTSETLSPAAAVTSTTLLTGEQALGDWSTDAPGVRRKITPADLPPPFDTKSIDNGPKVVKRPDGAMPKVPAGFKVDLFAENLKNPRMIAVAPNGDLFVAESMANQIKVLRDSDSDGKAETVEVFAEGLNKPFGIAFYPPGGNPEYVYVANTDSVVRFPYSAGAMTSGGTSETVVSNLSGGGLLRGGGHWTRDVTFSPDGKKMYVSVGSKENVGDAEVENDRARIFEFTPDGKNQRVYAHGIRNPVSIRVNPVSGELWTSVNERDGLGDHLVPDYISSVKDDGFYGWPYFYLGPHPDPRMKGAHPELADKVTTPDVLLQSHSASLGMAFYTGDQFPAEYKNDAFAAEHGSWNRERRTGYKVIQVPMENGKATGEYVDFMTGFVSDKKDVWGRPVAVAVGIDGSLFVSDDAGNVVWRVSYIK